jgi:hypothetical protein
MKLNLIPTYVSKEGQSKAFLVLGVLILLVSFGLAFFAKQMAEARAQTALENATAAQQDAANAVAMSKYADQIIARATGIDKNIKLWTAMRDHSPTYPNLYDEVLSYVPSFLRVTSLTASANGADGVTVNLTGVLDSFQQYADANLALLRIPNVVNVVRSNYSLNDSQVPNLSETDQIGAPVKPGEGNLPSDPMDRMEEMIARAGTGTANTYQGVSGFGDPEATRKGPRPNASEVSFVITIAGKNLQAPNPRATIESKGGAPAPR